MSKIPSFSKSYWTEYIDRKEAHTYPHAAKDDETEIVIIGAGIVGVLSAYELAKRGRKVILLEADRILYGTTGHTTAKITAQHGLFYDELIQKSGEEAAKLYYKANMDGLNYIRQVIKEEFIGRPQICEGELGKMVQGKVMCSVAKSLPDQEKVYDFILQLKKIYGIE